MHLIRLSEFGRFLDLKAREFELIFFGISVIVFGGSKRRIEFIPGKFVVKF